MVSGPALRHRGFAFLGRDLTDEVAVGRLAGHDGGRAALGSGEHVLEGGHVELAASFCRLVATLAIGLQDRQDIGVGAHRVLFSGRLVAGVD